VRRPPVLRLSFALIAAGALAQVSAGSASSTATCKEGTATIAGATVVTHCGPARATFSVAGKTFQVVGGKCAVESAFGVSAWSLNVGRQTLPPAKPKFAEFHATFTGKPKAGTYTKGEYVLSFAVPGQAAWSIAPGLAHRITVRAGAKSGTFTARFYTGAKSGTKPAAGSWTC
jgi:hypothetical protein